MSETTAAQRIMNHLMTERELQDAVIAMAKTLGLLVYHPYDSRRSEPGYPDLTIVGSRGIVYVELKRQGGKLTTEQKAWGAAIERVAAMLPGYRSPIAYYVWRPHEWHSGEIEDVLRGIA